MFKKIWNLAKKHLTEVQKKLLAAKIKKHKTQMAKIERNQKALVMSLKTRKQKEREDFQITKTDKDRFTKFKTALRKERISLEKISKKVTTKVLQNASKTIEYEKKIVESAKKASEGLVKTLKDFKEKRIEYKGKLTKIQKDKKAMARSIATIQNKKGVDKVIIAAKRNQFADLKRKEAFFQKLDGNVTHAMKALLRSRKKFTILAEKANVTIAKIEKNMKIFKIYAEAPIKHREITEKIEKIKKERNALIDRAISNSVTTKRAGLTFTKEEKDQIALLKEKEKKLQARRDRILEIIGERRSRDTSSISATSTLVGYEKKVVKAAKKSAEAFKRPLLNLQSERRKYQEEMEKIKQDRKKFAKPILERKRIKGSDFVMSSDEKTKLADLKLNLKSLTESYSKVEHRIESHIRAQKKLTVIAEKADGNIEKLEKSMEHFKSAETFTKPLLNLQSERRKYQEEMEKIKQDGKKFAKPILKRQKEKGSDFVISQNEKQTLSDLKHKVDSIQELDKAVAKKIAAHLQAQKEFAVNMKNPEITNSSSIKPTATPRKTSNNKIER
jgi:hypothetical protein